MFIFLTNTQFDKLCACVRGNYMTNPNKGKWYRFNDTVVEEFEMTEESLENECFGGKYKAKVFDNCKSHFSLCVLHLIVHFMLFKMLSTCPSCLLCLYVVCKYS